MKYTENFMQRTDMVRFAFLIDYNAFNLGNKFSWNITNDENKLDFIMIIEVGDDEDLSKRNGNKDGVEQINNPAVKTHEDTVFHHNADHAQEEIQVLEHSQDN